jgi:hypothetical protein
MATYHGFIKERSKNVLDFFNEQVILLTSTNGDNMKIGNLVRLGDSWAEEDRVLGIVTKIYEHKNRPCCDIFFADGFQGELIWLCELEVIK